MFNKYSILCVICARSGSKGIKNKNILPLNGKPLISHTIQQALKWGKAERVIVSTDAEKIARIARRYGAETPFLRPEELAKDNTPKVSCIRHALFAAERIFKKRFDIIVDLDVTSPLRKIKDLDNCLGLFLKDKPDTLFSVVKAHRNPYFNMVEKKKDGFVELCKKRGRVTRRQAAPEVYNMNASIYFYSRKFLVNSRNFTPFSRRTSVYVMDELSGYDIDRKMDLEFVKFLLKEGIWKNAL